MITFNSEYANLPVYKEHTNVHVLFYVIISGVKLVVAKGDND